MSDIVPDTSNRLAYWIGQIFHPAIISIPTLILVLSDIPLWSALGWTMVVSALVLVPGIGAVFYLRRQGRFAYQRATRHPIYIIAWCNVILAFAVVWLFNGPGELLVCLATLAVWLPLQYLINRYVTKISTHAGVAAGCFTGLLFLGKFPEAWMVAAGLLIVVLVSWARVMTKNHTLTQVLLGLFVGAGSAVVVFPLLLPQI